MIAAGSPDGGDNLGRFEAVCDGFARARAAGRGGEMRFRFAGQRVRLRVAGSALAQCIQAPFEHLREEETEAERDLTIDIWDTRETGVPGLPAALAHVDGRIWDLGDSVLAASADARFVSHEARGGVVWLDRRALHVTGWFADGGNLSLHQRSKPMQVLLALWASDRGLQAVHAGLVARDNRGVLLPGRSGSGKSTAALACLQNGYTFVGDDWIAIDRASDGSHVGHGLYGTASLESLHAQRFPCLQPQGVSLTNERERKHLLLLSRSFPDHLAPSVSVCALALPRVVHGADTRLRAASRREALLTIVPSSIFTMSPRGGRRDVERLFELAEQLPAYWLEIGRDLRQIPRRVDDILKDIASP